jgi:8-hydroxy-5-deazaflavin:NADPH oxidoreductase
VSTAIIGVGNIGKVVAGHLVAGGEQVVLAATTPPDTLAKQLGDLASAATVSDAIKAADLVVFAVWFEVMKGLIEQNRTALDGKVVVDPSNPVTQNDKGEFSRTLPDGVSAGSVIAALVPPSAHFVKAFGTIGAGSLLNAANRKPDRAVLFYATDDDQAQAAIERLISAAGFDPVKAGGVDATIRIEMFGDLHDFGGLNGKLLDIKEARAAVAAREERSL